MKLPGALFKTYKAYKEDTDRFTQWLGSTAVAAGHVVPGSRPSRTNANGGASGHHGRNLGTSTDCEEGQGMMALRTDDLVVLAKCIAQADPPILVPMSILKCASRAIQARRKCAEWFHSSTSAHGGPGDSADLATDDNGTQPGSKARAHPNQTHSHFISVLETVVSILTPLAGHSHSSTRSDSQQRSTLDDNAFAPLADRSTKSASASITSVGSDSDDELDHAAEPETAVKRNATRKPAPKQVQYRIAEQDDDTDIVFIIHSYFAEIQQVRNLVKDVWTQYRDGKMDLVTASLTTSCAVDLVREAEQEMCAISPAIHQQRYSFVWLTYLQGCMLRKEHPFSTDASLVYNESTLDLVDFFMLRAYDIASESSAYMKVDTTQPAPMVYQSTFGLFPYDPLVDRDQLSASEKNREDLVLIMSVFPFIHGLKPHKTAHVPILDDFTREMRTFAQETKLAHDNNTLEPRVTIALAFIIQVFIDTHNILRERASHGFADLNSTAKSIFASVPLLDPNTYASPNQSFHPSIAQGMEYLWLAIRKSVLEDPFALVFTDAPRFKYLESNPWLCGLIQYRLLYVYQRWSLSAAAHWGSVLGACHLYEAAKHHGAMSDQELWHDMEFVQKMHTKASMFAGKEPSDWTEAHKALDAANSNGSGAKTPSVSSVPLASSREQARGEQQLRLKAGQMGSFLTFGKQHRPSEPSPMCLWIHDWYESSDGHGMLPQCVESGLLVIARARHHLHYPHLATLTSDSPSTSPAPHAINPHTNQPYYYHEKDDGGDLSSMDLLPRSGTLASRKLPPLVLLTAFRDSLSRESPSLHFDYWRFHLRCVRLHSSLLQTTRGFLADHGFNPDPACPTSSSHIIAYLFQLASLPALRQPLQDGPADVDGLLDAAFNTLVDLMRQEGNVEVERLRKLRKYLSLRAQVPRKERRPPAGLWHRVFAAAVREKQRKWDRDVSPWKGIHQSLIDVLLNKEEDSHKVLGIRIVPELSKANVRIFFRYANEE